MTANQRLTGILLAAAALLLIPFVAMQFTPEVQWSGLDFVVAGVLLLGTGLLIEGVLRLVKKLSHRILLCAGVLLCLVLIWAELAVGIFSTPLAGS